MKVIMVHTPLDNDIEYAKDDIAQLFRMRWQAKRNLRSLKTVMPMEYLRCKEPNRVRNELRAHLLAYNLIRQTMVEAAIKAGMAPTQISFKTTLNAIAEMLPIQSLETSPDQICEVIFKCCQQQVVGKRPDRFEPCVKKRRPQSYLWLTKPRHQYKTSMT